MEVGNGMLFPVSVVDGLVHMYGGWKLKAALSWHRLSAGGCPVGQAVQTTAGNDQLGKAYDSVIHTVPPFYNHPDDPDDDPSQLLANCYKNALNLVAAKGTPRVATALIGAGCRGFPFDEALSIAAKATVEWCQDNQERDVTIVFGLLEESWAQKLTGALQTACPGRPI